MKTLVLSFVLVALLNLAIVGAISSTHNDHFLYECLNETDSRLPDAVVCNDTDLAIATSNGSLLDFGYNQEKFYVVLLPDNEVIESPEILKFEEIEGAECTNYSACPVAPVGEFPVDGGITFVPQCKRASFPSVECYQNCQILNDTSKTCGGTTAYCAWLTNNSRSCVPFAYCSCSLRTREIFNRVKVGNSFRLYHQNFTAIWRQYAINDSVTNFIQTLGTAQQRKLLTINEEEVYATYKNRILTVQSALSGINGKVIATKGAYLEMFNYTGGTKEYLLPMSILLTTGDLRVDIYIEGEHVKTSLFRIIGQKLCIVRDCVFCWELFDNWDCVGTTTKATAVVILILLIVLCLIAIPASLYAIYWIVWCLVMPFRMIYFTTTAFFSSKFVQDVKTKSTEKAVKVKNYVFTPREPDNAVKLLVVIFAFSLFAQPSFAQCASGLFVSATVDECELTLGNPVTKSCQVQFSLEATIPFVGSSACFTILDSSDNTTIVGTGEILYENYLETIPLTNEYITYAWYGDYESVKHCDSADHCPGDCTATSSDPTMNGALSDSMINDAPGVSSCRRACGCAGCSCFICSDSCIFSRYALLLNASTNATYQVMDLSTRTATPTVVLMINDTAGNNVYNVTTSLTGIPFTDGPWQLNVLGNLVGQTTEFGDNKIVQEIYSGNVYLAPACDPNEPIAGALGDIQVGSISQVTVPSPSSTVFALDIATPNQGQDSTTYSFTTPGYKTLAVRPTFPMVLGGNYWTVNLSPDTSGLYYDEVSLDTNSTTGGAVIVSVSTTSAVTFQQTTSLVCPSIEFINGTGCFECIQGFTITISAYSTCLGGPAWIAFNGSILSLFDYDLVLTTEAQFFTINGLSNSSTTSFCMNITANGGYDSLCDDFHLVPFNGITNHTFSNNTGYISIGGNGVGNGFIKFFQNIGHFFKSCFDGAARWWEYLLLVLFFGVALVILSFVLPIAWKIFCYAKNKVFRRNKMSLKMKSDSDLEGSSQPLLSWTDTSSNPSLRKRV